MSLEWKSEGVMDDESGEFMERAELVSVGRDGKAGKGMGRRERQARTSIWCFIPKLQQDQFILSPLRGKNLPF